MATKGLKVFQITASPIQTEQPLSFPTPTIPNNSALNESTGVIRYRHID
jgi:hypothetical protein